MAIMPMPFLPYFLSCFPLWMASRRTSPQLTLQTGHTRPPCFLMYNAMQRRGSKRHGNTQPVLKSDSLRGDLGDNKLKAKNNLGLFVILGVVILHWSLRLSRAGAVIVWHCNLGLETSGDYKHGVKGLLLPERNPSHLKPCRYFPLCT